MHQQLDQQPGVPVSLLFSALGELELLKWWWDLEVESVASAFVHGSYWVLECPLNADWVTCGRPWQCIIPVCSDWAIFDLKVKCSQLWNPALLHSPKFGSFQIAQGIIISKDSKLIPQQVLPKPICHCLFKGQELQFPWTIVGHVTF